MWLKHSSGALTSRLVCQFQCLAASQPQFHEWKCYRCAWTWRPADCRIKGQRGNFPSCPIRDPLVPKKISAKAQKASDEKQALPAQASQEVRAPWRRGRSAERDQDREKSQSPARSVSSARSQRASYGSSAAASKAALPVTSDRKFEDSPDRAQHDPYNGDLAAERKKLSDAAPFGWNVPSSKIGEADDDSSDLRSAEELKAIIGYYETQMKVAEDVDHPDDLAKFSRLREETRHLLTGTKPHLVRMEIFSGHIARLEKDIALQEERFDDVQAHHVKTLADAAEMQVKQFEKPPSQATLLAELAQLQKQLAHVSMTDNPFGIDVPVPTISALAIEQQLAAHASASAVEVAEGEAQPQMEVTQDKGPESPEFVLRTRQAEATITAKDAQIADIKAFLESQTKALESRVKALIAELKVTADKEFFGPGQGHYGRGAEENASQTV